MLDYPKKGEKKAFHPKSKALAKKAGKKGGYIGMDEARKYAKITEQHNKKYFAEHPEKKLSFHK